MGDFALMIGYGAIGFYFVFFLTDVAGLPAAWAGYIFLIARVWDAFIDYAMGFITDATKSRWGRRRPYILFGAIPFGIIFALLWIVPFHSQTLLFIYYLSISVLFNTAFAIISIPYNSMMPELTQDYDERTSISGVRMALSFSGTLVAAAGIMVVVDLFFPGKAAYLSSFPIMGCSIRTHYYGFVTIHFLRHTRTRKGICIFSKRRLFKNIWFNNETQGIQNYSWNVFI